MSINQCWPQLRHTYDVKVISERRGQVQPCELSCPRPCAHGVYNATTRMWGCPSEHKGKKLRIAAPLGPVDF